MTTVVVMGSCLTNLACIFLISDYKWTRPNNAAVMRSDYFVKEFIEGSASIPPEADMRELLQWKVGFETDGPRWLIECYREKVGHVDILPDQPGLFETLETQKVDVVLMDNLHETHTVLLHNRPKEGEASYSFPMSLSRCANEHELTKDFYYGTHLEAAESVKNWIRIIKFVQEKQPHAQILFYCAHACTSEDIPGRYERARTFYTLLAPLASELGITVIPPLDLPPELTRMPEDRDHFEWRVYKAIAGQIFLSHALQRHQENAKR